MGGGGGYCLFGESSLDLLDGLLLGDAVGGSDFVGKGVSVAGDGSKVLRSELVEGGSDLGLGSFVGHCASGLSGSRWRSGVLLAEDRLGLGSCCSESVFDLVEE